MAYEFKKLSDVETVESPADTANVLIEEDGVIKKAPKTAVGGAGGSGGGNAYDLVINFDGEINPANFNLVTGDYATLREKLVSGESVTGIITVAYLDGDKCTINGTMPVVYMETYADWEDFIYIYCFENGSMYQVRLRSDNTVEVGYNLVVSSFTTVS